METSNNLMRILPYLTKENLIFSPYSLYNSLYTLYLGSNGKTKQEFENIFKLKNNEILNEFNSYPFVELKIANRLLIRDSYQMNPDFIEKVKKFSIISFNKFDYKLLIELNEWIKEFTNGKMINIANGFSLKCKFLNFNIIYFKGDWNTKFDSNLTKYDNFFIEKDGSFEQASRTTMHLNDIDMLTSENDEIDANILKIPYENKDFSMIIILPKTSLKITEKKLETFDFFKIKYEEKKFNKITLPKFKTKAKHNLLEIFKNMGLLKDQNFSNIAETLELTTFIQQAYIEVDEEGTEACAITYDGMDDCCSFLENEFICNKSFLFNLLQNDLILFSGRIIDPEY